jgi:hypothetical protein
VLENTVCPSAVVLVDDVHFPKRTIEERLGLVIPTGHGDRQLQKSVR